MSKKYTILINNEDVIKKLDSLPERSKGAFISQLIEEKINQERGLHLSEDKIRAIIKEEIYTNLLHEDNIKQLISLFMPK